MLFIVSLPVFASSVEVYNGFSNTNRLIIEGRMLHKRSFKEPSKDDGLFKNIWRKVKQFTSDEIENQEIITIVTGDIYKTVGDDEGYFEFDVLLRKPLEVGYEYVKLCISDNSSCQQIKLPVFAGKGIGIISDFDDTVVISDVTNKLKLAKNIFLKNYKQRTVVPTMVQRFKDVFSKNSASVPNMLFFVTGSPQQLYGSIKQFLEYHGFPNSIIITKKIHGDNIDSLLDQFAYKTKQIDELFTLYPDMEWVMFGDSGEKDKEVYTHFVKKYPKRVRDFYIRDIESGKIYSYF